MHVQELYKELMRPFDPKELHWRLGATNAKKNKANNINNGYADKGIALAYIDARNVMERLDSVIGPFCWDTQLTEVAGTCACSLTLTINGATVTRTDTAGQTDIEGEKGAASGALRRAAAQFGVGRYLYMLPNKWVDVGEYGKFQAPELPKWALPENWELMHERIMNKAKWCKGEDNATV